MNKLYLKMVFLWILLIFSDTAGQLLFKLAALNFKEGIFLHNYSFILAYCLEVVSFFIWMIIIKYSRLSISLALTSLLYISVSIASWIIFHESINAITWIGTCLITLGACILGVQAGRKEEYAAKHYTSKSNEEDIPRK